jgi:hypothetical protein
VENTYIYTAPAASTVSCTRDFNSPVLGLGAIFSFTDKFGIRADGRYKYYSATKDCGAGSVSGKGSGGDLTATAYYNITDSLNVQLGSKFTYLNGGENIGYSGRIGLFGMVGYTHRF